MVFDLDLIKKVYQEMPSKIAAAKKLTGKALTLSEKILYSHLFSKTIRDYTRGKDYVFIYSGAGKQFTVVMGKTEGKTVNVFWFNPRNGAISKEPQIANTGNIIFRPPSSGYGQDWVLILDDATKNYTIH